MRSLAPRPALVALATLFALGPASASAAKPVAEATVSFGFGSAELSEDAHGRLERFVHALEGAIQVQVRVEGHADATGPEAVNEELSHQRAEAVAAHLRSLGLVADFQVRAFGSQKPLAQGDTAAAHARNRRVEVQATARAPQRGPPVEVAAGEPEPEPEPQQVAEAEPASEPEPAPAAEVAAETAPSVAEAAPEEDTADVGIAKPPTGAGLAISPYWAAIPAAVGVLAAAGAAGFFVDYALNVGRLDHDRAQLARGDLLPGTRSAVEGHATELESALTVDLIAGAVLGTTAAVALVSAGVLLLFADGEE